MGRVAFDPPNYKAGKLVPGRVLGDEGDRVAIAADRCVPGRTGALLTGGVRRNPDQDLVEQVVTKTSCMPLVSPATRLLDDEVKTT